MKVDYIRSTKKFVTKEEMEELINKGILDESLEVIEENNLGESEEDSFKDDITTSDH